MTKKQILITGLMALALILAAGPVEPAEHSHESPATQATVRVGTYDSRAVALAYGRSPRPDCMLAEVSELHKQHKQAMDEGDEEMVAELELKGPALQRRIHEQVFSGAPIPDILALIESDLPAVAEAAGVDLIVEGVLHSRHGVEVVDISMEMCAPFEIDEKTEKMIAELLAKPPVPADEIKHDH